MRAPRSDAEVIEASLADPAGFRPIFERHYDGVRRYLQRRSGPDVGEELAAQTFEEAFRVRTRYDRSFPEARPWLMGIATNLLRHHFRAEEARLRAYRRVAPMSPSMDGDSSEERMDAESAASAILRRLAEMEPVERDVVLLFAWEDLSYAEIARALAVPVGTVRSRLHRARRRLREPNVPVGAIGDGDDEGRP